MTALPPGIYADIPSETYHADTLTEQPSLSRSGIHAILTGTMADFAASHPRLTQWPATARDSTDATDLGEIVHRLVLGTGCNYVVRDPEDFTAPKTDKPYSTWSGEAKEWRDGERANGRVVIGSEVNTMAEDIAKRLLVALRVRFPDWDEGASEQTVVWTRRLNDGSVIWQRARPDRLLPSAIVDIKTTALSISKEALGKTIGLSGLDIQHAHYTDGVEAVTERDGPIPFFFAYVQTVPPHAIRIVDLTKRWPLGLTRERIDIAAHKFGACLKSGVWPDDPIEVEPEPPEWLRAQWELAAIAASEE